MKLKELIAGVTVLAHECDLEQEIAHVVYDSRQAAPGDLFVCIDGTAADGHQFAPMAAEKGASVIVAARRTKAKAPHILVADTRMALALIASNFYGNPTKQLKVIGVTGTNGKSTSTLLIKQILEYGGYRVGLINTIKNMIGDQVLESEYTTPEPLSLFALFRRMADEEVDFVVMEVSSHALAQHRVGGIEFEVGAFTNLTQDHLDFHQTMDNYKKAKGLLFTACRKAVINVDDAAGAYMKQITSAKETLAYAIDTDNSDLTAKDVSFDITGVKFEAVTKNAIARIFVPIPGKFTAYNALCAAGVCIMCGMKLEEIARALRTVTAVDGRIETIPTGRGFTFVIDYAHTPDGLKNILAALRGIARGRVVTVFGCGGDRDRGKRPLMGEIAAADSDFVIVTSDNPRTEDPQEIIADILPGIKKHQTPFYVEPDRVKAIEYAYRHAETDDIILLAGKGHETYQILKNGKSHLDEREVIAALLK